ncbi:MAG: N-acetylglucosamine-6-phosphate deacetylase [Firmicutes bacterium]|nr:N-acetylglucosamine-6-phosphate deacetylase [Bacillota bacterium]
MSEVVLRGQVILPDRAIEDGQIVFRDGQIIDVGVYQGKPATIHWKTGWIGPGLVDVHIHGIQGVDVMDGDPASLLRMDRALASVGCTTYLATTMSAVQADLIRVARGIRAFAEQYPDAGLAGVHMEGPYIHPARIGAQRADAVRPPRLDELEELADILGARLRRITMAPELPGAGAFIERAQALGLLISFGHSNASYDEAAQGFAQGVGEVTHLFNAMPPLHHREPGLAGAALTRDSVAVELICDGIHVHPAVVKGVARLKGRDGVMLVTDAMRATLLADGTYDLGGQTVTVAQGVARTASGSLAGSTLTLLRAVLNFQVFAERSLAEAVRAASLVPARRMGLLGRGALQPGFRADVILVDEAGVNRMTWRHGQVVFDGR